MPGNAKGYNLIEIMLAVALFAITVPVAGYLFSLAFKEEQEVTLHSQASFLAAALMDEMGERRFQESVSATGNSPDSGELNGFDRRGFDDIDDYSIFSESTAGNAAWNALNPPRDESGIILSPYSKFSQWVKVENILPITAGPTGRTDYTVQAEGSTNFKLVTVRISWDSGKRDVTLYKVFAKH